MTAVRPQPAVRLPLEGWSDISRVVPPDGRVLTVVAAGALLTDLALRNGLVGVAGALLVAVVAGGLLGSGLVVNRAAIPLIAVAPLLGAFLAVRMSPWVLVLDVFAAGGVILLGASYARGGDPLDLTIPNAAGRIAYAAGHSVLAPAYPFTRWGTRRSDSPAATAAGAASERYGPLLRGIALAAPVVVVVGALLASADAVFASFLRVPVEPGDLFLHAVLLALGAWGASTVLRMAAAEPFTMPRPQPVALGSVEAATVLGGLAAVLSVFAAAQVTAAVRGAEYVERAAGLSYAEYAREGFFQLLAVAVVTLAVLLAMRATVDRGPAGTDPPPAIVLAAGLAVIVLTLVVVGVAARRLFLYEAAYGLTMLRLTSLLFAVWIGVVFVLLAAAWLGVGGRRQWLVPAAIAAALAGLLGANGFDLERIVVTRNVERFAGTERVDIHHLLSLSDDAVPAIIDSIPKLRAEDQEFARAVLCGERPDPRGLWRYNASRARADRVRSDYCGFTSGSG